MERRSVLFAIILISTCFLKISTSATIAYQQGTDGYAGFEDTYIVMSTDSTPDRSPLLIVEGYHCSLCIDERALLRFDLTSFDTSNKVVKAELQLYSPAQPRPGAGTIRAYKLSRPWTPDEATWFNASSGAKWSAVGGDFSATPAASLDYGTQLNVWHTLDVTQAVRDFIADPASNFGLLLMLDPSMLTVAYVSSEGTRADQRPKLTITFSNAGVESRGLSGNRSRATVITRKTGGLEFPFPSEGYRQLLVSRLDGRAIFNGRISGPPFFLNTGSWANGSYAIRTGENSAIEPRNMVIFK
jgi:hypothetical protein